MVAISSFFCQWIAGLFWVRPEGVGKGDMSIPVMRRSSSPASSMVLGGRPLSSGFFGGEAQPFPLRWGRAGPWRGMVGVVSGWDRAIQPALIRSLDATRILKKKKFVWHNSECKVLNKILPLKHWAFLVSSPPQLWGACPFHSPLLGLFQKGGKDIFRV